MQQRHRSTNIQVRDARASWQPGQIAEETKPHRHVGILYFHSLAKQDTVCYTCFSRLSCKIVKREVRVETRSTQLLKGTLDMCLLATIAKRPCYGYEMVQQLAQQR